MRQRPTSGWDSRVRGVQNWVDRSGFMIEVTFELVHMCATVNWREDVSASMLIAKHWEMSRDAPETKRIRSTEEDQCSKTVMRWEDLTELICSLLWSHSLPETLLGHFSSRTLLLSFQTLVTESQSPPYAPIILRWPLSPPSCERLNVYSGDRSLPFPSSDMRT